MNKIYLNSRTRNETWTTWEGKYDDAVKVEDDFMSTSFEVAITFQFTVNLKQSGR